MSLNITSFIVLIGILVFIHELGHFLVARLFNIGVEVFSIGFGPKLLSFKRGNTLYQIALIPLGGYVKLIGATRAEEIPEKFKGQEMYNKAPWKRLLVLAAGPLFNVFLAILIFASLSYKGFKVADPVIGHVFEKSVAQRAGLKSGDRILSVGKDKIENWNDMVLKIMTSPGKELSLTYLRDQEKHELKIKPKSKPNPNKPDEKIGSIGILGGYLKSIITIQEKTSKAYLAGLRTGDRIQKIEYLNKEGVLITTDATLWRQMKSLEKKVSLDQPLELTFILAVKKIGVEPRKVVVKDLNYSQKGYLNSLGISLNVFLVSLPAKKKTGENSLKSNDVILSFQGKKLENKELFSRKLFGNKKEKVEVTVLREDMTLANLTLSLGAKDIQGVAGKETIYPFNKNIFPLRELEPLSSKLKSSDNIFTAIGDGAQASYYMSLAMVKGLWQLITGKIPLGALGGPIMIAKIAGDSAQAGLERFFEVMALISLNLAIVNFIPIPVLDGGQMVIVCIEWIRRKPMSLASLENFYKIGFIMVFSLIILSTYNDLSRFWVSMVKSVMEFLK